MMNTLERKIKQLELEIYAHKLALNEDTCLLKRWIVSPEFISFSMLGGFVFGLFIGKKKLVSMLRMYFYGFLLLLK